jgi:hypothetical protein
VEAIVIALRLVRLIDKHSEALADRLLAKVLCCPLLPDYDKVPFDELKHRVRETYQDLSNWLLGKPAHDIKISYREIGARRAAQHVPLSQVIWAIALTKENLWEFLDQELVLDRPLEIFGELEILKLAEQFFQRAQFYASIGYEQSRAARSTQEEVACR